MNVQRTLYRLGHLGWVPNQQRTLAQTHQHEDARNAMPSFTIRGKSNEAKKVIITDLWGHPTVTGKIGFKFPGFWQLTGSCVGVGLGNVLASVNFFEVAKKGEAEEINVPFWPLPYGRSRYYMGDRSPGEGSLGSTAAKAAKEDGCIRWDSRSELPRQNVGEQGLNITSNQEYAWSDGDANQTMKLLPESKQHLIRTVAPINNTDQLWEAISNWYPCTWACSYYVGGARVQGSQVPVALGKIDGSGGHQTSCQGIWEHPEFGRLFLYVNQWQWVYPQCPSSSIPRVGCWVQEKTAAEIIREGGECYAFSQHDGYPAQKFSWGLGDEL